MTAHRVSSQEAGATDATYRGVPRSARALFRFAGTALLAGFVSAMFGGGIALVLGLSPIIAGGVSGAVASVIVAVVILRHGQAA